MPRFPSGLINTMKLATPMILTNIFFRKDGDQSIQYCVLLNRAPTSTQLHLPPPSSFQPPTSSFKPPSSSLYPIARYWAISPNFGRKIKSCPFWMKIGTHGILEVLIPNPNLDFWNFDHKIHFRATLGQKFKAVRFVWKLVHVVSPGFWFRIQT